MDELRIIGVEHTTLLLSSEGGDGYRVEVDEATIARLQRAATPIPTEGRKLAPRDIQAQIRAGLSAEDVAKVTGSPLEYVRRFEGPVLAEREYVIESALAVPVRAAVDPDPLLDPSSFGDVIRTRLSEANAADERWASWKEPGAGWIVKLTFTIDEVEHDARWGFEPKKQALSPLNQEATKLSQQGEVPAPLVPRLRAVPLADTVPDPTRARFDSGAFETEPEAVADEEDPEAEAEPRIRPVLTRVGDTDAPPPSQQTADLLEALRRRRGEREPIDLEEFADLDLDDEFDPPQATSSIRLVEIEIDSIDAATTGPIPAMKGARGKGRATMPSWDDIVFGARPDDVG